MPQSQHVFGIRFGFCVIRGAHSGIRTERVWMDDGCTMPVRCCVAHYNLFVVLFWRRVKFSFAAIPFPMRAHSAVKIMIYDDANFIRWWIRVRVWANEGRHTVTAHFDSRWWAEGEVRLNCDTTFFLERQFITLERSSNELMATGKVISLHTLSTTNFDRCDRFSSFFDYFFADFSYFVIFVDDAATFTLIAVRRLLGNNRCTEAKAENPNHFHIEIRPSVGQRWHTI